jgi:predicted ferric reductase
VSGNLPWDVARASGLVAWVLLSASVVWGLAITTRVLEGRPRPAWVLDLHRHLGGLATIFVVTHVVALLFDTYVGFGLVSVLVPFASTWHPLAVAWGVVAFYVLVAVEITSLLRSRISKRAWRLTHFASLPLFALATIHGLTAGTDAGEWLVLFAATAISVLVAALIALRASNGPRYAAARGRHARSRPRQPLRRV